MKPIILGECQHYFGNGGDGWMTCVKCGSEPEIKKCEQCGRPADGSDEKYCCVFCERGIQTHTLWCDKLSKEIENYEAANSRRGTG